MKKLLTLIALLTLTAGCRSFTYETADGGKLSSTSFLVRLKIGELSTSTNGALVLKDYDLSGDEAMLRAAFELGKAAAAMAVK